MISDRKESLDSNLWSFVISIIFGILLLSFAFILYYIGKVDFEKRMGPFEFVVISLAVFRLTRLLVYDSIALWIRDLFLDRKVENRSRSTIVNVKRSIPEKGLKRKMAELFSCPWCTGTWVALFVLFFHYLHPISWWFILGAAIAGFSTFIQILANLIGWNAEESKRRVTSLKIEQEGMG